ncbi:hypothetical protein [Streptomyces ardesiacus]|uniref:hypothetical protein n=1 Tax=Streptomyces ardesiacus TaxID=285564 RepID=UPI0036F08561
MTDQTTTAAVLARIRQMADYWEQHLPEVIRTPAVVSALRAALDRAPTVPLPPAVQSPIREHLLNAIDATFCQSLGFGTPEGLLAAYEASRTQTADRAALRDRIACAIEDTPYQPDVRRSLQLADAVLAVLPATVDRAALVRACASFVRDTYSGEWADDAAATLETDADKIERGEPCSLLRLAAVLPATTNHATDTLLPAWEAVYEPGNVSDYLIGYANDQDPATGMAEAWLRSQAEVTGRLEWVDDEQMATGRYDRWFELIERHDDGVDTGPGIIVRRRVADEVPLSPFYEHPECGFHWHGRDGMDIPMRDGQPVCPRCELARVQKKLDHTQKMRDEVGVECKRRGKRVLEQSERVIALERQVDEVQRQLGAEILRAGQAEAELRRVADETAATATQAVPVQHAPGKAILCPDCRAKGYTVCRNEPAAQACPPGCIACATDESHDPAPAAGARQDGTQP